MCRSLSKSRSPSPRRKASPPSRNRRSSNTYAKRRSRSRSRDKPSTGREAISRNKSCNNLNTPNSIASERDQLLSKWRKNYCATGEEVSSKIEELSKLNQEDVLEREKNIWTRSTPADLYYVRDVNNPKIVRATPKLLALCEVFNENLVLRAKKINEMKPKYDPPPRKNRARLCKHKCKLKLQFCTLKLNK